MVGLEFSSILIWLVSDDSELHFFCETLLGSICIELCSSGFNWNFRKKGVGLVSKD